MENTYSPKNHNSKQPLDRPSRTIGCMLGGAVGDALGAPVEFMKIDAICNQFGKNGIIGLEKAYGRIGAITDDTQMSLFTAEGLILSKVRREYSEDNLVIPAIYHAYLRWIYTQEIQLQEQLIRNHGTCSVVDPGTVIQRDRLQATSSVQCMEKMRSRTNGYPNWR